MPQTRISRRQLIAGTAAFKASAISAPFVRSANAAGRLTLGLWDHWVPGANDACSKLIDEWAAREKIDVTVDYITSQGNKLLLTIAAEAQARAGHDVIMLGNWLPIEYGELLEPVDDVMKALVSEHGSANDAANSYGRYEGKWVGIPSIRGTFTYPCVSRMDLLKQHAGVDVTAMYPASSTPNTALADTWTYDAFLEAAAKCHRANLPFGLPLGQTADAIQWVGSMFSAFGAELVDAKGNVTVDSDAVREVLDYSRRLKALLPRDVPAWDDASNNKWLVSGKGALIINAPSAWAVAKRDAPAIAAQIWHHPMPKGAKGRFTAVMMQYLSIWKFSKNKSAARSLIAHLSTRSAAETLITASNGYDLPSFDSMNTIKVWDEQGPPLGTTSHYATRPGSDQRFAFVAAPAPASIAAQINSQATMPKMILRHWRGETIEKTIDWAAQELESFARR